MLPYNEKECQENVTRELMILALNPDMSPLDFGMRGYQVERLAKVQCGICDLHETCPVGKALYGRYKNEELQRPRARDVRENKKGTALSSVCEKVKELLNVA